MPRLVQQRAERVSRAARSALAAEVARARPASQEAASLECRAWTSSTCAATREFSVVDGTLRVDDMVAAAAKDGQGALAITDLSNLFGAVKFYSPARKKGVKPILGADVWLESDSGEKQASRLLLLVQSREGYLNLCEILSRPGSPTSSAAGPG